MKTLFSLALLAVMLGIGWTPAVQAQDDLRREPGYVDLSTVERWFDTEPWLEVNIKGALLRLVAEASRYEDPELAALLLKLKAIQVRGYPVTRRQFDALDRRTAGLAEELGRRGWDTVARIRDRDERVDMYIKVVDGKIAGMMVMVLEPGDDESVFVNIVGEIDPEQIGRIGSKFNIGPLQGTTVRRR